MRDHIDVRHCDSTHVDRRGAGARARLSAALACVVLAAGATACTFNESDDAPTEFEQALDDIVTRASEGEATTEQLAILEEAQDTGEIPFEAYRDAVDRGLDCLRATGAEVADHGTTERYGVPMRSYSVDEETELAQPALVVPGVIVHTCMAEHSAWVELIYQGQPATIERQQAHWEQHREPVLACLREHGVEVDSDAPVDELRRTTTRAYTDGETEVSCAAEAGVQ